MANRRLLVTIVQPSLNSLPKSKSGGSFLPLRNVFLNLLNGALHSTQPSSQFQVVLKTLKIDDRTSDHTQRCVFGRIRLRRHVCDA